MEKIAELIERLDNIIAALGLSMPDKTHMSALREILPKLRDELKFAYFEMGGEDVWADEEDDD